MKKSKWRGIIGFCKDHRFLCVTIGYVLVGNCSVNPVIVV